MVGVSTNSLIGLCRARACHRITNRQVNLEQGDQVSLKNTLHQLVPERTNKARNQQQCSGAMLVDPNHYRVRIEPDDRSEELGLRIVGIPTALENPAEETPRQQVGLSW